MHITPDILNNHLLPKVAVVILNYNGMHYLQQYLPSVLASSYANADIYVVDNASTDESVAFVLQNYPTLKVVALPTNYGFAKGYNKALAAIDAAYYVLLNSDVEVTPGWIDPIVQLMETNTKIGACQPKILAEKNKTYFEYAGACGGWIDRYGYPFARGRVLEQIEKDEGQYNDAASCFWASGAALFVRAQLFKNLGGLDEYFFAHQEEIDLCWRMQLSGYQIYVQPSSVIYHLGGGTLPKGNDKKIYLNFRNNLIMIYKNTPIASLITLLPVRFILDALAAYKALLTGNYGFFIAVAKAHFHFVRWVLLHRNQSTFTKPSNRTIVGQYRGSILWQHYVNKKNKFSQIVRGK